MKIFSRKSELYKILLGKHETKVGEGIEFEFKVSQIIKHERFQQSTFENDIAILKTSDRVEYNEYIRPICLPDPSQDLVKSRFGDLTILNCFQIIRSERFFMVLINLTLTR